MDLQVNPLMNSMQLPVNNTVGADARIVTKDEFEQTCARLVALRNSWRPIIVEKLANSVLVNAVQIFKARLIHA